MLRPFFADCALTDPSLADMSVEDTVGWLQRQLGYDQKLIAKYTLHDLFYILSGGISGSIADEYRAGITEYYMLSNCLTDFDAHGDRLIARGTHLKSPEEIGRSYARGGQKVLLGLIGQQKEQLKKEHFPELVTNEFGMPQAVQDKIDRLAAQDETIQKLQRLLANNILSFDQVRETTLRAQAIDRYFRDTHQGRRLESFAISEIRAMKMSEFGICAVTRGGRVEFEFFGPIPGGPNANLNLRF